MACVALALATMALAPGRARADEPKSDAAVAESLFQAGKALMSQHRYAEACPKLAESYRLDSGTGTLLALAFCHEAEGKTATAWAEFTEVQAASRKDGRGDREKAARQRITALEPLLSRLTIQVPAEPAAIEGIEVRRDGVVIGSAEWGTAVPVDPGDHLIDATAPGRTRWSTTVKVGAKADKASVTVPPLAFEPSTPAATPPPHAAAPAPSPEVAPSHDHRTLGVVLGGAGLLALGAGAYFGLRAISDSNSAKSECSPGSCTNQAAVDTNNAAKTDALVSDVAVGVGIAAVAVGAYIYFTSSSAPNMPATGVRVAPLVGAGTGGVSVGGRF